MTDYVAELKALWTDADYHKPIELPHSNCVAWVKKWIEEKRVIQIFKMVKFKKKSEFETRCSSIFHQPNFLASRMP